MESFHPSPLRAYLYALGAMLLAFAAESSLLPLVQINPDFLLFAATAAIALAACAYAAAQCHATAYSLEDGSLSMHSGILSSREKVIPIKNIDNVEVRVSAFSRLLGVADVYVDTPGGTGYELAMRDVPQDSADMLLGQVEKIKTGA